MVATTYVKYQPGENLNSVVSVRFTAAQLDQLVDASRVQRSDVFVSGEGGYHTFRIPSIIAAPNGDLLAFCEGRRNASADSGDIDLLLRRSTDGGKTWGDVRTLWDDGPNTCGNPCPVIDRDTGVIHLLVNWNRGDDVESKIKSKTSKDGRHIYVMTSGDSGATWSKPREITDSVKPDDWAWYATGPGAGIQIERGEHRGRLVIPCDHSAFPWQGTDSYRAHAIYSDDHGKAWRTSGIIAPGVNECEVVELTDGRLMMNMRNYRRSEDKTRAIAYSSDGGETWSKVTHDEALIEPICQGSIRRMTWPHDGKAGVILFSNPASRDKRVDLTIRASFDDGGTWPVSKLIQPGPAAYSCLVALPGGRVGCLYEAGGYKRIVFASFDLDWLTGPAKAE
ncbi:MAG: exo-alpha-sialidase [Planctomycetes bacterium]|nr:exo-alpha-sialidase [Planctomycetota bacterium]